MAASQLGREQWVGAALDALIEGGMEAIRVEKLARDLGVTKGSFYWHFKNRAALVEALLELWEEQGTTEVICALEAQDVSAQEKLMMLISVAWQDLDMIRAESILQAAAARNHGQVVEIHGRITRRRLEYTTSLYCEMGLGEEEATHWARMAYGLFLGTLQMVATMPELFPEQQALTAFTQHLERVLMPAVD